MALFFLFIIKKNYFFTAFHTRKPTPKIINVLWTLFPKSQLGLLMSNTPVIMCRFNY